MRVWGGGTCWVAAESANEQRCSVAAGAREGREESGAAALVSVARNTTHRGRWEKGLDNSRQRRTTERWEQGR